MGTTLVSAISFPDGVVVSNVGDSRAYFIEREQGITRITKDHSVVENMVDRGDITAEEARRHPNKNLITRALGPDVTADCDGYICPMETQVIPNIDNVYRKERARDELPQSGSGRTIMTAEPKFVPEEAAQIQLPDGAVFSVRLIDCVGYMIREKFPQNLRRVVQIVCHLGSFVSPGNPSKKRPSGRSLSPKLNKIYILFNYLYAHFSPFLLSCIVVFLIINIVP